MPEIADLAGKIEQPTMTSNSGKQQQQQPLLTATSVALSLAPPRSPPHGSALKTMYTNALRNLLHARTPGAGVHNVNGENGQHQQHDNDDEYQSHTLKSRLLHLLPHHVHNIPHHHPHLPTSLSLPDTMTRFLGAVLPLESQHSFRDGGGFKRVADTMVKLTCPLIGVSHPSMAREFLELTYAGEKQCRSSGGTSAKQKQGDAQKITEKGIVSSPGGRRSRWTRNRIPYGDHDMQFIDLFLPSASSAHHDSATATKNTNNTTTTRTSDKNRISVRGTIFFVHGGAWGSGQPWMYRLVAPTFLKLNFAVVIVGYRTYPEAQTIEEQVGDVRLAWDMCGRVLNRFITPAVHSSNGTKSDENDNTKSDDDNDGWVGNVIMGHSSGAHVAMLMLVYMMGEYINKDNLSAGLFPTAETYHTTATAYKNNSKENYPWQCDFFVGLSGPYDISYHFDYEGGRGVEQISPMKPICGHSRINFHKASPAKHLMTLIAQQREDTSTSTSNHYPQPPTIQQLFPPTLLVHGIEDSTVPFTATSDAGRILRSCGIQQCDEIYLEETGHEQVVMHFMLGGAANDLVMGWLLQGSRQRQMMEKLPSQSKL